MELASGAGNRYPGAAFAGISSRRGEGTSESRSFGAGSSPLWERWGDRPAHGEGASRTRVSTTRDVRQQTRDRVQRESDPVPTRDYPRVGRTLQEPPTDRGHTRSSGSVARRPT